MCPGPLLTCVLSLRPVQRFFHAGACGGHTTSW